MSAPSAVSSCSSGVSFEEFERQHIALISKTLDELSIKHTSLSYLSRGVHNIVFRFDQLLGDETVGSPTSVQIQPCIIRLKTLEEGPIEDALDVACDKVCNSAAIACFVHEHLPNTPRLLYVYASPDNPLGRPFTIQTRVPGSKLSEVWADAGLDAKKAITERVADFLIQMQQVRLSRCGRLCAVDSPVEPEAALAMKVFGQSGRRAVADLTPRYETIQHQATRLLPSHILNSEICDEPELVDWQNSVLERLGVALEDFEKVGSIDALMSTNINDACLKHMDLHAGNILVHSEIDADNNETFTIHVIDWDGAQAVPPVLGRGAPAFLWRRGLFANPPSFTEWDGNVDHTPWEVRDYRDGDFGAEIKNHFDVYMQSKLDDVYGSGSGATWLEHAYGDGMWIRRATDFCLKGFGVNHWKLRYAERFLKEWQEKQQSECWAQITSESATMVADEAILCPVREVPKNGFHAVASMDRSARIVTSMDAEEYPMTPQDKAHKLESGKKALFTQLLLIAMIAHLVRWAVSGCGTLIEQLAVPVREE